MVLYPRKIISSPTSGLLGTTNGIDFSSIHSVKMFFFRLAYLSFLAITILATTLPTFPLQQRQTAAAPGIVAKVISPNGTDLTSGFQTVFYHPDNNASSKINDRDLSERQSPGISVRAINSCRLPRSRFKSSICHYQVGQPNSMQRFLVYCHVRSRGRFAHRSRIITEWVSPLLLFQLHCNDFVTLFGVGYSQEEVLRVLFCH